MLCLALELVGPCVMLGFSVGMEAFDELLSIMFPGVRSSLESERKKEKRIKRNEDNLRDLQENIKRYNIRIIGVPEEDKKKDHEKILEEIIVENFAKMWKEIITP